jgi:hypothetical protein
MMRRKQSGVERRLLRGFLQRAEESQAPLLVTPLRRYASAEGLSWEELARSLGGTHEGLDQVALCGPPRPGHFAEDVAAIAAGNVDADRLLLLLRQIQVLEAFTGFPAAPAASRVGMAHGMLLAARDRKEAEESAASADEETREEPGSGDAEDSTGEEPSDA